MIYLIGGPPKCGKTTLAKILSRELSVPWISADTLQNIAWSYLPKDEHLTCFPHRYIKGDSNDDTYSKNSAEEIIEGYIQQGKTSYKAINMIVETMIADEDSYIVEGYQVSPEIVYQVIKKYGKENVRCLFLVKHNEEKFIENIRKSTTQNDWIVRKTKEESTFDKIAHMISLYSKHVEKEAKKYNFKIISTDHDFKENMNESVSYLKQ
ncbi:MAG: hypothetical protein M3P22_01625 [bacterium]|nr:hypothetical protein [bacterium]